jgi:hypothetical protein
MTTQSNQLLSSKGIQVNVGIDNQDIILLVAGVFFAVTLGAVVSGLILEKAK